MKLAGIKVVDLSQFMPGPMLAANLADHGADVIKIEPVTGDPSRDGGPAGGEFFAAINRGKRSLALNLKQAEGRAIALKIIADADVVIESSRPGVAARLGIDYGTVSKTNPRLVYCAMTAFGQTGPLAQMPAHDPVVQSLAGTLPRDRTGAPITSGVTLAALTGSLTAFSAVLMALLRARETGQGDYVDISLFDAALAAQPHVCGTVLNGISEDSEKASQGDGPLALLATYQTADFKWLCLGGREYIFASNLLTRLGRPDLIDDAVGPSGENQERVRFFLTQTFLSRTLGEWLSWFEGLDISVAPVLSLADAFEHPHTRAREMIKTDQSGRRYVGNAIKYRNEPCVPNLSIPMLGEHSEAILSELGYSATRIDELHALGVVHLNQVDTAQSLQAAC